MRSRARSGAKRSTGDHRVKAGSPPRRCSLPPESAGWVPTHNFFHTSGTLGLVAGLLAQRRVAPGAWGSSAVFPLRPRADQRDSGETSETKQTTRVRRMPTTSLTGDAKSRATVAALAWLLFIGIGSQALAQNPLAIPSNLGAAPLLPSGPPRVTVHPRPHLYRRCTRWYLVQISPASFSRVMRVPFPDTCPVQPSR